MTLEQMFLVVVAYFIIGFIVHGRILHEKWLELSFNERFGSLLVVLVWPVLLLLFWIVYGRFRNNQQ